MVRRGARQGLQLRHSGGARRTPTAPIRSVPCTRQAWPEGRCSTSSWRSRTSVWADRRPSTYSGLNHLPLDREDRIAGEQGAGRPVVEAGRVVAVARCVEDLPGGRSWAEWSPSASLGVGSNGSRTPFVPADLLHRPGDLLGRHEVSGLARHHRQDLGDGSWAGRSQRAGAVAHLGDGVGEVDGGAVRVAEGRKAADVVGVAVRAMAARGSDASEPAARRAASTTGAAMASRSTTKGLPSPPSWMT